MADARGITFEHTFRGLTQAEALAESDAIGLLAIGDAPGALPRLQRQGLAGDALPFRMLEAQWLLARGYTYQADLEGQVIRWINP
jgi:hypothetical protein